MTTELWKPVPIEPYGAYYEVSNLGRVRSTGLQTALCGRKHLPAGFVYKTPLNGTGRQTIGLRLKGVVKHFHVYRLVALAFIPNPLGLPFINHIDGIPSHDRWDNIEWCTQKENIGHSVRTGLHPLGERHPNAKLTGEKVSAFLAAYTGEPGDLKEWARKLGVSKTALQHVLIGKTWRHIPRP